MKTVKRKPEKGVVIFKVDTTVFSHTCKQIWNEKKYETYFGTWIAWLKNFVNCFLTEVSSISWFKTCYKQYCVEHIVFFYFVKGHKTIKLSIYTSYMQKRKKSTWFFFQLKYDEEVFYYFVRWNDIKYATLNTEYGYDTCSTVVNLKKKLACIQLQTFIIGSKY